MFLGIYLLAYIAHNIIKLRDPEAGEIKSFYGYMDLENEKAVDFLDMELQFVYTIQNEQIGSKEIDF